MLEAMEGMLYLRILRCYSVKIAVVYEGARDCVLYARVLDSVLCVLELMEGVRPGGRGKLCTICCWYGS